MFCLLAAAMLAATLPARAQMAPPVPMSTTQFRNAATGSAVKIVVRVSSFARNTMHAQLLDRIDDSHYKATGTAVTLYVPQDVPVVMGSAADFAPNAVLFVYGTATALDRADVTKTVVLTQYVTIK